MNKSHLTAIRRHELSAPMQYLYDAKLLRGTVLDYGCGRGDDVNRLTLKGIDIQGFDPYWAHWDAGAREIDHTYDGTFDTITCNYVLNVIPDKEERDRVIARITALLSPGGTAFIAVRNDRKNLNGYTSKGTWQGYIDLSHLKYEWSTSSYKLYSITK